MASKGLDPLAGLVSFTSIDQDFARRGDGYGYGRCLVPLTSFIDVDGVELRDPDTPLLTLAGLVDWLEVDGVYVSGMCVLTQTVDDAARNYAAPLVVTPANYNTWMDGWNNMAQLRNCCSPVLRSRLVAV
jgi:putative SOS response-associated peptidase YedK